MKEDIENSSTTTSETRSVFIGAKVTPSQKEYIKSQAEQCGMTVSDYLFARACNYHPKGRVAQGTWQCSRKRLSVSECRKRTE